MTRAIVVNNVSKKYKLYRNSKERLYDILTPKNYGEDFYALTKVNFEANQGEVIGFIGINGSGKSTLSNIIAGIVPETSGSVTVKGEVSLIAVAAGLKNDLTGRENIELKLLMLGFEKSEIKKLEPNIIEYSELGNFIDQPVKSYSSGMKSRLGFAISVNVEPEILIIDEALSVGDKAFAEKSLNKIKEFKHRGKTMIFVSHSIGQMKQFCDKILWLEFGLVKEYGLVEDVIPKYENFLTAWKNMDKTQRLAYTESALEKRNQILNNEIENYYIDINNFYKKKLTNEIVSRPVSILCHIKSGQSFIYDKLDCESRKKTNTNKYKNSVYFIKKQAIYQDEIYYLLSTKPSAVQGIIGWIKASSVSAHRHVAVDQDEKEFTIKGQGSAYNLPWGGKKNLVYESLEKFRDERFEVNKTELVGNNVWYRGELNKNKIWIHERNIKY